MWIIQESIAHVDAEIICGRASMPWLLFLFGVEKSVEAMRLTVHVSSMLNEIMSNVMTLQTSLINWHEWKGKSLNTKETPVHFRRETARTPEIDSMPSSVLYRVQPAH